MHIETTDPLAYLNMALAITVVLTNAIFILSTKVWYRWIKLPYFLAALFAIYNYIYILFIEYPDLLFIRLGTTFLLGAMAIGGISSLGKINNWFCVVKKWRWHQAMLKRLKKKCKIPKEEDLVISEDKC